MMSPGGWSSTIDWEASPAGGHRYVWRGQVGQGRSLPTGIYYFELTWQNSRLVRQVVLLK